MGKKIPKTVHQPETVLGDPPAGPSCPQSQPPSRSRLVPGEQTAGPGGKQRSRASSRRLPGVWSAGAGGRCGQRGKSVS